MRLGVRSQITLFFGAIFTAVLFLVLLPSALYFRYSTEKDMELLARQALRVMDSNIVSKLDELVNVTDIVMVNQQFQAKLDGAPEGLVKSRIISDALFGILLYDTSIMSAVYCEPNSNSYWQTNSGGTYDVDESVILSPLWRGRIGDARGELVYFENGGGALQMINMSDEYVSFVRDINRITDYSPMGTLMLNITRHDLSRMLLGTGGTADGEIFILDENQNIIATNSGRGPELLEQLRGYIQHDQSFYVLNTPEGKFVVTGLRAHYSDWTLVSVTPLNLRSNPTYSVYLWLLAIAILVVVLVFIGQVYLSGLVVTPLAGMAASMKNAESGSFTPMNVTHSRVQNEITDLQSFYNSMLLAIDSLTKTIKREERLKRKNEIALLQEQIKPHFLYNALDAISALTLIEDNKTAYALTQALSGFYRTSLSVGYATVTVDTELTCVRNYIRVLNIRYKDKIRLKIDAPPAILELRTLKLVLQPLVENAVYHGLRKRDGVGDIFITAAQRGNTLVFTVRDNGVGMTPERVEEVLSGRSRGTEQGFGIYSLIEKLRLAGDISEPLRIVSSPEEGTTVEITMPIGEEE